MKLRATDQIHISAVKADSLRPGEEFEVSEDMGIGLLTMHPCRVARVDVTAPSAAAPPAEPTDPKGDEVKAAPAKAMPAPANKAEAPPANKSRKKRPAT